jgi:two-component system KDP operon response regulator KdpE
MSDRAGDTASTILVVDDEPQLVRILKPTLTAAGYSVVTAETGAAGVEASQNAEFDAILLDLGLPDMDGKEVLASVRRRSQTPVLVLSARDRVQEKIECLDLGANDYVAKPFTAGELLARIRAAIRNRRPETIVDTPEPQGPPPRLVIEFDRRRALVDGRPVKLSKNETAFLRRLTAADRASVDHRDLFAAVWGEQAEYDSQYVRVLAAQVRQKLGDDAERPELLVTVPGLGYRLTG